MNIPINRLALAYRFICSTDDVFSRWGSAVLLLIFRLWISWQFFHAGLLKLSDWSVTLDLFREEYHVPLLPPAVAAVAGAGGELFFPLLLTLGLFSRPAALGLFCVNLMAVISYPQLWQFDCPAALQSHFYWGAGLILLTIQGSGAISLDAMLNRLISKRRA